MERNLSLYYPWLLECEHFVLYPWAIPGHFFIAHANRVVIAKIIKKTERRIEIVFSLIPSEVSGWLVNCTVMKRVTATHAEIIFFCYINFSLPVVPALVKLV